MTKTGIKKEEKRVLCYFCKKPIHMDELGGVFKLEKDKEAWFHDRLPCLVGYSDLEQTSKKKGKRLTPPNAVEREIEKILYSAFKRKDKTFFTFSSKTLDELLSLLTSQKSEWKKEMVKEIKSLKASRADFKTSLYHEILKILKK